jgi:hypothetical protein
VHLQFVAFLLDRITLGLHLFQAAEGFFKIHPVSG